VAPWKGIESGNLSLRKLGAPVSVRLSIQANQIGGRKNGMFALSIGGGRVDQVKTCLTPGSRWGGASTCRIMRKKKVKG